MASKWVNYPGARHPDSVKTLKLWDSELKGFGLVVLPSGRRTYCIEYRNTDRIKNFFQKQSIEYPKKKIF
jgi:hypothetical protein